MGMLLLWCGVARHPASALSPGPIGHAQDTKRFLPGLLEPSLMAGSVITR